MKTIATGVFSFNKFIEQDNLYVDKTMYAYRLAKDRRKLFFLARPRRFGKSLLCSMLHSLFEGNRELFKGLYIDNTDYSFESYSVIHLDFSGLDNKREDNLLLSLSAMLKHEAQRYGITLEGNTIAMQMDSLFYEFQKQGKEIVLLIDEFDAPFTSKITDSPSFSENIKLSFNTFYQAIKKHSGMLRFLLITGVVKLANLSIFSAMNNLADISMEPRYASILGYTEEEFEEYFGEGIDEQISENVSREQFIGKVKSYYDGYRFSPDSDVTVYNPVSIGAFFNNDCRFRNYWDMTGVSTLAVNLAVSTNLSNLLDTTCPTSLSAFYTFDLSNLQSGKLSRKDVLSLLYFSGYLTIQDFDDPIIYLGFPNREVAGSFSLNLLSRYSTEDTSDFEIWVKEFRKACRNGDEKNAREKIEEYFNAFSYDLIGKNDEKFFHSIFHAIFVIAGMQAISEDRGLRGRADEVIIEGDYIWIFELKVDGSAADALHQIEEKGYEKKYSYLKTESTKVLKVGISFSSETKKVSEWKCIS